MDYKLRLSYMQLFDSMQIYIHDFEKKKQKNIKLTNFLKVPFWVSSCVKNNLKLSVFSKGIHFKKVCKIFELIH